jgi:hypothetical protein
MITESTLLSVMSGLLLWGMVGIPFYLRLLYAHPQNGRKRHRTHPAKKRPERRSFRRAPALI